MKEVVEVIPNAKRVFAALRDIGYDFNSAVADLIDNSIAAGATGIEVSFRRLGRHVTLSVVDDGSGMDAERLLEAVRLGSNSEYEEGSLGKYGMGLKTASLSQTKCLIVGSRTHDSTEIHAYELNLDHIDSTNRWELLRLPEEDIFSNEHLSYLRSHPGTYVLWDGLDRIEDELRGYSSSGAADSYFGRLLRDLKLHLRMTFHRFLSGEAKSGEISIFFNGEELDPWDPFCRYEKNSVALRKHQQRLTEGGGAIVVVEPYILPTKDGPGGFSTLEAWEEAKGLLSWNDSQGYYVYRNDRLIHFGGWLRTRAKDEHSKYARVGIYFDSCADEAFSLSVNKSQLRLPASLYEYLKFQVNPEVVRAAQKPYREAAKQGETGNRHKSINRTISKTAPVLMSRDKVTVKPTGTGDVAVVNARGQFISNSEEEATQLQLRAKFSVQTGAVEDGRLWKVVCRPDGGFSVVLNCQHPFYQAVYERDGMTPAFVSFMDALLFSMAYVELKTASTESLPLFAEIRDTVSATLREMYFDAAREGT